MKKTQQDCVNIKEQVDEENCLIKDEIKFFKEDVKEKVGKLIIETDTRIKNIVRIQRKEILKVMAEKLNNVYMENSVFVDKDNFVWYQEAVFLKPKRVEKNIRNINLLYKSEIEAFCDFIKSGEAYMDQGKLNFIDILRDNIKEDCVANSFIWYKDSVFIKSDGNQNNKLCLSREVFYKFPVKMKSRINLIKEVNTLQGFYNSRGKVPMILI